MPYLPDILIAGSKSRYISFSMSRTS